MKDLRNFMKLALLLAVSFSISNTTIGQCTTWKDLEDGSVEKETAESNYQIYKDHLKSKNYEAAMVAWEKLMEVAPAADGRRISPFWDGIKLIGEANKKETDKAKIEANNARIVALHKQCIECLQTKKVVVKGAKTDEGLKAKIADQKARQAEDMYKMEYPATDIYAVAKEAVEMGGQDITYKVMFPYAASVIELYQAKTVPAEEARRVHGLLNEIADENTIKQEEMAEQYLQDKKAKKERIARQKSKLYTKYKIRMNKAFKKVESEIFDCEYFKGIYMTDYEEGKDDLAIVKTVYSRLKKRKCTDEDPFIMELKERYKVLAAASNAEKQDSFDRNNPAVVAKKRYDAGDYTIAIEKWEEAISGEADPNKQATYLFRIASTQGRKLKQYAKARTTARKAAKLKPNWGRPFMLIGDLYASSARRCGDDWNQRMAILAAIDKYSYAKSLDPEVAEEANRRIGKYNQSRPEKADGFSRGINAGSSQTVGCWIGESVKVRFK
jgi:hypothetical protein